MEKVEVLETVAPTKEDKERLVAYIQKCLNEGPNLTFGKPTVHKLLLFFLEECKRAERCEALEKKNEDLRLVLKARIGDFTECVTALLWLREVDASLGSWVTTLPPSGKGEYVNTTEAAREAVRAALASVSM